MELLKLLKSRNIFDFIEVKNFLSSDPYNLIIKEDSDFPNLYMLVYDRDIADFSNSVITECRGIILEKNTNKILCYAFNKGLNIDLNSDELPNNFDWNSVDIQESIDGTQIRLFYYQNQWQFGTTRCIDARKARWFTTKSFYEMYKEVDHLLDYERLDKECCYSFVLQHPENRIVVKYDQPNLIHVLTRNLETLEEENRDIGIQKPKTCTEISQFQTYQEILNQARTTENLDSEGYMLVDKNLNRIKVLNQTYINMKELKGNTNNLFYRFLQLCQDNLINEYLEFYPEVKTNFGLYKMDLFQLAKAIHQEYIRNHVTKISTFIPGHLKTIIYKLHGIYLTTHQQTTLDMVIEEINKLHPNQICYIYNRTFTPHHPFYN